MYKRRFEHVAHCRQALVVTRLVEVAFDHVEHLLRRRQVAGRLQDEQPVGCGLEDVQFAIRADVVDAGVGTRVRQEDQTFIESKGEAVRHVNSMSLEGRRSLRERATGKPAEPLDNFFCQ